MAIRHGHWGGGAGVDYFFLKNVGVGTDANASNHVGNGGRGIEPVWQWVYGRGVGLEVCVTHNVRIFFDARLLWANKDTDYNELMIRAGLRLAF